MSETVTSRQLQVGLISLPTGAPSQSVEVPVHLTEATQAYLEKVMSQIPEGRKGQARLVIDWKQIGGFNAEAQIGTHVGEPQVFGQKTDVDAAAMAGWSKPTGVYYGAELRIVF